MKKIEQGKYELFTTKEDAIVKLMQMQGLCREEISDYQRLEFYCSKKGKITVTNPPSKHIENTLSTTLYAEIIEQEGKTYVAYHTVYSNGNNVLKIISLVLLAAMSVLAVIFALGHSDKKAPFVVFALCCAFFILQLINTLKEKKSAPEDCRILIKELEKRVEAVNLWDK